MKTTPRLTRFRAHRHRPEALRICLPVDADGNLALGLRGWPLTFPPD